MRYESECNPRRVLFRHPGDETCKARLVSSAFRGAYDSSRTFSRRASCTSGTRASQLAPTKLLPQHAVFLNEVIDDLLAGRDGSNQRP